MNIFQRVQARLRGSDRPSAAETTTYSSDTFLSDSSDTYSSTDNDLRNRSAPRAGAPGDPNRLPALCPDCGSREAGAEWNRERTSFLLSCPDCGLSQRTELLAPEDETPLAWRHGQ